MTPQEYEHEITEWIKLANESDANERRALSELKRLEVSEDLWKTRFAREQKINEKLEAENAKILIMSNNNYLRFAGMQLKAEALQKEIAELRETVTSLEVDARAFITDCQECRVERDVLQSKLDKAVKLMSEIEIAESRYRIAHDVHGSGHRTTGYQWDQLRKCGDAIRKALAELKKEDK